VQGDLGTSIASGRAVTAEVLSAVSNTLLLAGMAALGGVLIGCILGALAGYRHGTWIDRVATFISVVGVSIPHYWLGLVLTIAATLPSLHVHIAAGPPTPDIPCFVEGCVVEGGGSDEVLKSPCRGGGVGRATAGVCTPLGGCPGPPCWGLLKRVQRGKERPRVGL